MSENYNNKWNNDDFQNNNTSYNSGEYFTYNETHLAKKEKKKFGKAKIKLIALMAAAAVFGSALTGGAMALILPGYISNTVSKNETVKNQFQNTSVKDNDSKVNNLTTATGDMTVVDIAKKVGPSVVGVVSTISTQSYFGISESQGSGSGVIISEDGYVVTNNHVISGAKSITVYLSSGEQKSVKVVGSDAKTDLAVLKLEDGKYPYAKLGNSSEVQVGELCVAIGNPLGMEFAGSVTVGYISALNRTVQVDNKTLNVIQTDAAINAGNSGGALVNTKGEVIGINTLKVSSTGVEGLGFAIPVDNAKPVLEDLMNYGYVKGRPVVGIVGRDLTSEIASYYNYPEGIFVEQVQQGSGAAAAGLKRGDIITHIDGERVKTVNELNKIRDKKKAGQKITLELDRSGEIVKATVVLGEEKSSN